ncbi:MAG: hypothetical protein JSS21_09635 [Proteobacteria bacterium]|nr:hypothetical protein [Pseudomonadota bacterium]
MADALNGIGCVAERTAMELLAMDGGFGRADATLQGRLLACSVFMLVSITEHAS